MKIELELLADQVLLPQHNGKMAVPESEEVVTLSCIEGLSHLLNATLRVLTEASLQLTAHMLANILVELVGSPLVALLVQVFKDCIVDVLLRSREVIQIDSTTSAALSLFQVVPRPAVFTRTWRMPTVHSLESLRILVSVDTYVSV